MNKVLILWLWNQWQKYVNYFLKNNYYVDWVCNTIKTKVEIESNFNIKVFLSSENINYKEYFLIVIALPIEIQWQKALEISKKTDCKILVEIPVSFDFNILEQLVLNDKVFFYLEEKSTILSKTFSKINTDDIKEFNIILTTDYKDINNIDSLKVSYIHMLNNFLFNIDYNKLKIKVNYHNNENIFYKISFKYKNINFEYVFKDEKYLIIWDKKIKDKYNFDFALINVLNQNLWKKYYLKNYEYVWKICKW